MKKIFIYMTIILLVTGCGSSSSNSSSGGSTPPPPSPPPEDLEDVEMVISSSYVVYPGNKLSENSYDTLVKISHVDGQTQSTVILLKGSATIIRNP